MGITLADDKAGYDIEDHLIAHVIDSLIVA